MVKHLKYCPKCGSEDMESFNILVGLNEEPNEELYLSWKCNKCNVKGYHYPFTTYVIFEGGFKNNDTEIIQADLTDINLFYPNPTNYRMPRIKYTNTGKTIKYNGIEHTVFKA